MAQAELSPGIENLRGKVSGKSGMTMRVKVYKNDDGHIIKYGPQEYFHRDKRDYKQSPRTAAEARQADFWRMVCREASLIIKDKTHPRYAELRSRWNAQFKNGGDAFLNEGKSEKVVYGMFPVFVRMVIMKEKKGEMSAAEQA